MKSLNVHGKKSKELLRDPAIISPSDPRACPYAMNHAKGSEVGDKDGNRFTDFASGIAVCSTNHSYPKIIESIKQTNDKFIHKSSDFYHPVWIQLSERIVATSPFKGPAKVFLGNSGTEAVEAAIKLTRSHTDRKRSIDYLGTFHGQALGSLAFTSSKTHYRDNFSPMMSRVTHVPYPDSYRPMPLL